MHRLRAWAHKLRSESLALYYAARDPRTPWYAKLLAGAVVAYALSPIDLIPDFIPVLGFLDEALLLPLGIALTLLLVPDEVLADARALAERTLERPTSRAAAAVIVLLWMLAGVLLAWALYEVL